MSRIRVWTAFRAALAAFLTSAIWYMAFNGILVTLNDAYTNDQNSSFLWIMLAEFGRSFVIALALYYLVMKCGISGWKSALKLGAFLWIFPAFILSGSVLHENYPIGLALIHAGDWLVKLLVLSVIIGGRQKSPGGLKVSL